MLVSIRPPIMLAIFIENRNPDKLVQVRGGLSLLLITLNGVATNADGRLFLGCRDILRNSTANSGTAIQL